MPADALACGATLQHLRCLRDDNGWIDTLLDEAENERMHLMTFMAIIRPTWFERFVVVVVQGTFYNAVFLLYVLSPRTARCVVGYFEEAAVISYNNHLAQIDDGTDENLPAPQVAIAYWNLPDDAQLRDVIVIVRAEEAMHRDVNHDFADRFAHKSETGGQVHSDLG